MTLYLALKRQLQMPLRSVAGYGVILPNGKDIHLGYFHLGE